MKKTALLAHLLLAGCASVTRGTTEDVVIQYEPAGALIVTSLGVTCAASPCTMAVKRKTPFTVTASMAGYKTQIVEVNTKVSDKGALGFAGNVVAGGVIGMGVDAATGATKDHFPNPVIIALEPDTQAAPAEIKPIAPAPKPAKGGKPVS